MLINKIYKNNINIHSLANITNNKYYIYVDIFNNIPGIMILENIINHNIDKLYYNIFLLKEKITHYKILSNKCNNLFDSLFKNKENLNNTKFNKISKFGPLYDFFPNSIIKLIFIEGNNSDDGPIKIILINNINIIIKVINSLI